MTFTAVAPQGPPLPPPTYATPKTRQEQRELAQQISIKPGQFDYSSIGMVDPKTLDVGFDDIEEMVENYEWLAPDEQAIVDTLLSSFVGLPAPLMPHQIVPWNVPWWNVFALKGGRGIGKTGCGSHAVMECIEGQLQALGPHRASSIRIGIGGPHNVHVRDVCMDGETGLMTLFGSEFTKYKKSVGQIEARHKSGAYVRAQGMEAPKSWNGPQWSMLWIDEFPLCNPISFRDAYLALRLGPKTGPFRARTVVTFTPKDIAWVGEWLGRDDVYIPMYLDTDTGQYRPPSTYDNPHLPEDMLNQWRLAYEGTRVGLRELHGIEIGGVSGALWEQWMFDHHRQPDPSKWPDFIKVVVAIDPAGTSARADADKNALTTYEIEHEEARRAKTAICVLGLGTDGRIYILFWVAGRWSPNTWASKAVDLYHLSGASLFVAERNFGGDMVEATLRNVWQEAPIEVVSASDGKRQRAEPVVTLFEQKRFVPCAVFPDGEAQCCAFKSSKENEGADYVDCLVWGTFNLMGWKTLGDAERGPIILSGLREEYGGEWAETESGLLIPRGTGGHTNVPSSQVQDLQMFVFGG